MESPRIFKNRSSAGKELADKVLDSLGKERGIVVALPRGGVAVAKEIALQGNMPLFVLLVRKIGHPMQKEYALGALTQHRVAVYNTKEKQMISTAWVKEQEEKEYEEMQRRMRLYPSGSFLREKDARNRVVILVDDGVATGYTLQAAIKNIKAYKPRRMVVAVPVIPRQFAQTLRRKRVRVVALHEPLLFKGSVSQYYEHFGEVTNEQVVTMLDAVGLLSSEGGV